MMTTEIINKLYNNIEDLKGLKGKQKQVYIKDLLEDESKIKEWDILFQVLEFQYDKRYSSGINKKSLDKVYKEEPLQDINTLMELLNFLKENNTGSNAIISTVQGYIRKFDDSNSKYRKLLEDIVMQNLKVGIKAKVINKVIEEYNSKHEVKQSLIFDWQIQGGKPRENLSLKEGEEFVLQQKLNGIRATYYKGQLLARSGKEHFGFCTIIKEIEKIFGKRYVIDGELIRYNHDKVDDNTNFRLTASIVNSKEYTSEKETIHMRIYDIVPVSEFDKGDFTQSYITSRMDFIQSFKDNCEGSHINILPIIYKGSDQSVIEDELEISDKLGLEGLMLYKDCKYKKAKHNGLIKIKSFKFSDLRIVDWYEGDPTGKWAGLFGGFIVEYKGNTVKVGGGYTDEQREYFLQNADKYIGRIAEIKYKEESQDSKTGLYSVQFPIMVSIRELGKEVSYE